MGAGWKSSFMDPDNHVLKLLKAAGATLATNLGAATQLITNLGSAVKLVTNLKHGSVDAEPQD